VHPLSSVEDIRASFRSTENIRSHPLRTSVHPFPSAENIPAFDWVFTHTIPAFFPERGGDSVVKLT